MRRWNMTVFLKKQMKQQRRRWPEHSRILSWKNEKTIRDLKAQVAELALNAAKKVTAANTTVSDDLNFI